MAARTRKVPDTPSALRKYAERAGVGDSERARIGTALLLADRLADLDARLSMVLEVLLKTQTTTLEQLRTLAADLVHTAETKGGRR